MAEGSSTRHAAIRARLDEIGATRQEHLRLRAEASALASKWVPEAIKAGIPIAEIARRAHLTRASVYAIRMARDGQADHRGDRTGLRVRHALAASRCVRPSRASASHRASQSRPHEGAPPRTIGSPAGRPPLCALVRGRVRDGRYWARSRSWERNPSPYAASAFGDVTSVPPTTLRLVLGLVPGVAANAASMSAASCTFGA